MASVNLTERVLGRTQIAVARAGATLESDLRVTAPRASGDLQNNTYVRPAGPRRLDILVGVDYATYVRDGTNPHFIFPSSRQYLAFQWPAAPQNMGRLPDGRVLARAVRHPGTDPNPWYNDALNQMPSNVLRELAFTSI